MQYSESLASQGAELNKAQGEAKESGDTVESVTQELTTEQAKSESYQALLMALSYYQIQKVHVDVLTDAQKSIYTTIKNATGVAGVGDTEPAQTSSDSGDGSSDDGSDYSSDDGSDYSDDSGDYGDEYYE